MKKNQLFSFNPNGQQQFEWEIHNLEDLDRCVIFLNCKSLAHIFLEVKINGIYYPYLEITSKENRSFRLSGEGQDFSICFDEIIFHKPHKTITLRAIDQKQCIEQVFLSGLSRNKIFNQNFEGSSIALNPIKPFSQIAFRSNISNRICAATSLVNALNMLDHSLNLMPLDFAGKVYDRAGNIYGNWAINVSHASIYSKRYQPCIRWLESFQDIYDQLMKHKPVVVSVKGKLPGAAKEYTDGHLMTVYGWNKKNKEILCIDSALPTHQSTTTCYPYDSFISAWEKRNYLAFIFS